MCGIVGYVGKRPCLPILIEGLKRLEYHGYDSAGVAVQTPDGLKVVKAAGKIRELENRLVREALPVLVGTRPSVQVTAGETWRLQVLLAPCPAPPAPASDAPPSP